MVELVGVKIHISGIVQGVGFRPFVYTLAQRYFLKGWVRNTSAGVDIEVEGDIEALGLFIDALRKETPPLARIDDFLTEYCQPNGFRNFEILESKSIPEAFQPISPDVCICSDCLRELFDLNDRRFLYPFINCTNCGPRFTIIKDIPYDRPKTTMADFEMCALCSAEYHNPVDRRFHAQPIACPTCGPKVWLEFGSASTTNRKFPEGKEAISHARCFLNQGKIVAVKGLGGFHLACDATNASSVTELRRRKLRVDKPFALMMLDIATIENHCYVDQHERELLESRNRPIVLLNRRPESTISLMVAPSQNSLGVMLPYTPLHYLLLSDDHLISDSAASKVLVMTSGNISEEPIAIDNDDARNRLSTLADAFLMHDRPIRTRCDDSVMRIYLPPMDLFSKDSTLDRSSMPIRRSRGYAPFPVNLPNQVPPLLAVGAELKNTFCITRDHYAFLSHHIGDMENYETFLSFEEGIRQYERLFRVKPKLIACDLHPDYLSTRYAKERSERDGIPAIPVQHHHAHVASCMAENKLSDQKMVIGISFDGTGYGEDGRIWGGEFLVANYSGFFRPFHILYISLPGGDKAVREPWRMALAWFKKAGVEWDEALPPLKFVLKNLENPDTYLNTIRYQLQSGVNAPLTSSVGRLFDAVSSIVGVRHVVNYEAQAAIELEALVEPGEMGNYLKDLEFEIEYLEPNLSETNEIDPSSILKGVISDVQNQIPVPIISGRFHNSIAKLVSLVCQRLRKSSGLNDVVLSGGVWQNRILLDRTINQLSQLEFSVYIHHHVPANDGGISLGQAIVASQQYQE